MKISIFFFNLFIFILIIFINYILSDYEFYSNSYTLYDNFKYSNKLTPLQIQELKKGQKKMTYMLSELTKLCRKYNIKYWLTGGSLIGVLLYKNWIPWDGDIDMCMLEEDYNILKKVKDELPSSMWFQTLETDPLYDRKNLPDAKIRDLKSCYLDSQDGEKWHNGLQIDILTYKKVNNKLISRFKYNDYQDYQYNEIFPLKTDIFDNIEVYIPNKYKIYSIKNWKYYPPQLSPISKRFPHEGIINSNKTCKYHYNLYPSIYKK